jgi:hypothetical protein
MLGTTTMSPGRTAPSTPLPPLLPAGMSFAAASSSAACTSSMLPCPARKRTAVVWMRSTLVAASRAVSFSSALNTRLWCARGGGWQGWLGVLLRCHAGAISA